MMGILNKVQRLPLPSGTTHLSLILYNIFASRVLELSPQPTDSPCRRRRTAQSPHRQVAAQGCIPSSRGGTTTYYATSC